MPDLTETGVEFTDLANSLTTGQLKITYLFASRDAGNAVSRSSAPRMTKRPGIQGLARFVRGWRSRKCWRLAKAVSR
jgi:hypothetical protein